MLLTRPDGSRRGHGGKRGFTLTELMIALLIMGLIMSVVYRVFSSQDRFFRNQEQVASMQENLRATMEYINQEMSWLGYRVPGIAVIKASPADIIFKANIPNTGSTIQFVRYQFDPSTNTIRRAAGADSSAVENADLTVMASDIEALAISYYNILNGVVTTSAADPLCADELAGMSPNPCDPGTPDDDASLLMIQRIKARVTARTSKPDWMYTDPQGGPNPNYRKRSAVLDLRARNIEDVTLQGGQIVVGSCGYLIPHVHAYTNYNACRDKTSYIATGMPSPDNNTWDDNPYVTIEAYDKDGHLTTAGQTTVYAVAGDGTPYNMYAPDDALFFNNYIANGETRYISAGEYSTVATNTQVYLRFGYDDGLCTMVSYDGDHAITVSPSAASYFYTGGAYVNGGISVDYVDNGGSPITLATPDKVAMCSTYGNERVRLGVELYDDCQNPIPGETIVWNDGGFGGSFTGETDNGDGTYSATYIPPNSMGSVSSVYTGTLTAQWGAFTPAVDVDFIAAGPHDIVIDSILDVTQAGIFNFSHTVLPRATQLGGNSGNSFQIERVDGQQVEIKFHIEDACGNRVFGQSPVVSASRGLAAGLPEDPNGIHSVVWESDIGCGQALTGETITISDALITNPSTQFETVSFNLLETRSSVSDQSGPFVVLTNETPPPGHRLQAGNTADFVELQAVVSQYDSVEQYCTNIPGVFPVQFEVTGDANGNGSFSSLSPYDDTSETVDTSALGVAGIRLYSGTGDWDTNLTITATATIGGATYDGNAAVSYEETTNPQLDSGFYEDSNYFTKIGSGQAVTTFDPGKPLFIQIFDWDENEDPNAPDSISDPYTMVTVESALTGDVEEVNLGEEPPAGINSPKFRQTLDTLFFPAVATTLERGDGTLQVRDGDTITMHYEDKDNPGDADDWTIYTRGADTFRLFKVDTGEEILPPADSTQVPVAYGDKLRPELSLPFLASDGRLDTDTVTITLDSGDDSDTLVLREEGDTGIMVPDINVYGNKHFIVSQTDAGDAADILLTPTTPRRVTLVYDASASSTRTITFFMRDYDPPEVIITSPDGTIDLSGQVDVMITANDVGNATTLGGIGRIELYIGGRLYYILAPGSDLSGSNTIIWSTATGSTPHWLDGSYVLTAKAFDTSNNEATSAPVNVTVRNNLAPIWIDPPAYNSIWSQDVGVQVNVDNLASEAGTYEVILAEDGGPVLSSWTGIGNNAFNYILDTTGLPQGGYGLIATIEDLFTHQYQTTALDLFVDRTAPVINIGSPFNRPWIGIADFPLNVPATITDFKVAPTDPNDVDDTSVKGTFSNACSYGPVSMSEFPPGSDTFPISLTLATCGSVDGVLALTVVADDMASPPNQASRAFSTRIDTIRPTVISVDVTPIVPEPFTMGSINFDGFVRGSVTLSAAVSDAHLTSGAFAGLFINDPGAPSLNPDWADFKLISPVLDATSGAFTSAWNTAAYDDGIYVIGAGVLDAAGNSNASSPSQILYLDNGVPSTAYPNIDLPMGVARGPVYVSANSQANDGFLMEVEHRFVRQGGNPANPGEVVHSEPFTFTAQSMTRNATDTYVMDTSSWSNGMYEGYSYVTDWAGNTSMSGPSPAFQVDITRLESGSLSATFSSVGPGQFEMSATGRIVDAVGNGVAGVNLRLLVSRYVGAYTDSTCTTYTYSIDNTYEDITQSTNGSGNFSFTVPTATLTFENPLACVRAPDYFTFNVYDSSSFLYGYLSGYLNDPPLQLNPSLFSSTRQRLISNLATSLDPFGPDWQITVTGNLIDVYGQAVQGVTMRFTTWSYNPFLGTYETNPSSGYYTTTTGSYGDFSLQLPTVFPTDPIRYFYVDIWDDSRYLGYIYQPSPTPNPAGIVFNPY